MRPRDVPSLLTDILGACDVIAAAAAAGREEYLNDPVRRSAVERQIEVIGESLRRLLQLEPGLTLRIHEAREVIRFRNFLAHGYFLVDHTAVWKIVQTDVPTLRSKAAEILEERRNP
jgi:uncharacterized protein with HEPN domain